MKSKRAARVVGQTTTAAAQNTDSDKYSTQTNYKNLSQCQKETIADKENIFTVEGLLSAIIEDIATIKEEHRSTQKSLVSLIPILRQIVREEITRLRGYV